MAASGRFLLIKIHMLLAAFIFPVALMFLITGGLYTWEITGSYAPASYRIRLDKPISADVDELSALVMAELDSRSIDYPTGKAKIKKGGTSFRFEWTGSQRDVILDPTNNPRVAKLVVKETSWYRNLVQLHKAKGGTPFKFYAAVLAVSLFLVLLSGFLVAWQMPKYRGQVALSTAAGAMIFLWMLLIS